MRKTQMGINIKKVSVITLLALILTVVETYYWAHINSSNSGTLGHKPSVAIYSFCIILLLFSSNVVEAYHGNKYTRYIEKCGVNSFSVYLTHCLFILILGAVCHIQSWTVRWIAVLMSDLLFVCCVKYAIPSKWHKYIGIR